MPGIYETTWHGLDLLDIAKEPGRLTGGIPNALFYTELYRRFKEGGYVFSPGWLESKANVSRKLRQWLVSAAEDRALAPDKLQVLSIAAGLGVVELPLLQEGFDITLHEVAQGSFDYFHGKAHSLGLESVKTLVCPMERIPESSFDVLYMGTCEYCYRDDAGYAGFLSCLPRMLKSGGRIIAWDGAPTWKTYVKDVLARLPGASRRGVPWGVFRTPAKRAAFFRKAGLKIRRMEVFDRRWDDAAFRPGNPSWSSLLSSRDVYAVIHAEKS